MHFSSSYNSGSTQKFEMKQFWLKNSAIYWQALFIYYLLCTLATGDFYDCLVLFTYKTIEGVLCLLGFLFLKLVVFGLFYLVD